MNLSFIRLITFDVTGTLLKFRTPPLQIYNEVGSKYGINCNINNLKTNFKSQWHNLVQGHPNFGAKSGLGWEEWWRQMIKGTFKDCKPELTEEKLDQLSKYLIVLFETEQCWEVRNGIEDLLNYLTQKKYTLGVISNFDPRLRTILKNTKIEEYFTFVLTSYEMEVEKPDPDIFKKAMNLSLLKYLKLDECVHIGNTIVTDYYGAKSIGWHAKLLDARNPQLLKQKYPAVDLEDVFPNVRELHKYFINEVNNKLVQ